MEIKLVEVRGPGTLYPCIAIRLGGRNDAENWLLSRAGYGRDLKTHQGYILLGVLDPGSFVNDADSPDFLSLTYQPELWEIVKHNTILAEAHQWLDGHWGEVYSGDVIDVDYISGRSTTLKISDRFDELRRTG